MLARRLYVRVSVQLRRIQTAAALPGLGLGTAAWLSNRHPPRLAAQPLAGDQASGKGKHMVMPNYFTVAEVAEHLERRVATINEHVAFGQLMTLRLANGEYVVPSVAIGPRRPVSESDE